MVDNDTGAWGSHKEVLEYYARRVKGGRIIEYGSGNNSTPMLHQICQEHGNNMVTVEQDIMWLTRFQVMYPGFHWHHYVYVQDYTDLLDQRHNFKCDLAFIDSYTWGSRLFCIQETIKSGFKTMVIHDCDFMKDADRLAIVAPHGYTIYDKKWPPTMVVGGRSR